VIVEDKVKLKKKIYKKDNKEYKMYFVTFSVKYSDTLKKFKELHNIEIITGKNRIILPKANLFKYSFYVNRRTGQKIPQFSFVIPKETGEELEKEGIKTLKVIVELPDLTVKS
jgi:hypothetical protein